MASVESIRRQLDVIEMMPPSMRGRYLKAIQAAINSFNPKMARTLHKKAGWHATDKEEITDAMA